MKRAAMGPNPVERSYRFTKSISEALRAVTPAAIPMAPGVLLINSPLTTALPRWLGQ